MDLIFNMYGQASKVVSEGTNLIGKGLNIALTPVKGLTNIVVGNIVRTRLLQQDSERIQENQEGMRKLTGGDEWHNIIHSTISQLFDEVIQPALISHKRINGWFGGAISGNKEVLIDSITSMIETILRRLASDSSMHQVPPPPQSQPIVQLGDQHVNIVPPENAPVQVSTQPYSFGASIFAEIIRIVKEVASKDEYKMLREGDYTDACIESYKEIYKANLEKTFLRDVFRTIIERAFPDKEKDKSIPIGIRKILSFMGLDNLVEKIVIKLSPFMLPYREISKFDLKQLDENEIKFTDSVVDLLIKKAKSIEPQKIDFGDKIKLRQEQDQLIRGILTILLGDKLLYKDKLIVDQTFGFVGFLAKKLVGQLLLDFRGDKNNTQEGLIEIFTNILSNFGKQIRSITPGNKKEKVREIFFGSLVSLLPKAANRSDYQIREDATCLLKCGEFSAKLEDLLNKDRVLPQEYQFELQLKMRLVQYLPPEISLKSLYEETILPGIEEILPTAEIYAGYWKNLSDHEFGDIEIIESFKGLPKICDHYCVEIMKMITDKVDKGALPVENPMAAFVNPLVKKIIQNSDNNLFIQHQLSAAMNRVLAHLLSKQPENDPQVKIGSMLKEIFNATKSLIKGFEDIVPIPDITASRFEVLIVKHRKIFGKVDINKLTQEEQKKLYKCLLLADPLHDFLKVLLPDELLTMRQHIIRFAAKPLAEYALPWIEKGSSGCVLEILNQVLEKPIVAAFLKDFKLGDDVKSVRKALNQLASVAMKNGMRLGFEKLFGENAAPYIQTIFYVLFYPLVVVGHWILVNLADQLLLKRADQYLSTKNLADILKDVVGKVPDLLNAIHNKGNPHQIAKAMLEPFRWAWKFDRVRDRIAKEIVNFLTPKERPPGNRPDQLFFTWLDTKIPKVPPQAEIEIGFPVRHVMN